jgi:DNA-binding HxlR family transcriptional regulator
VKRTRFDDSICPIARTTDLMGDWWTPVIMRDFLVGPRRFDQLQARLQVSRATLTQRLERLVAEGLLDKREYQSNPVRYEYFLTEKGKAFWAVLAAMWSFGEDWLFGEAGPTVALKERETGRRVKVAVVDAETGLPLDLTAVRMGRAQAVKAPELALPAQISVPDPYRLEA